MSKPDVSAATEPTLGHSEDAGQSSRASRAAVGSAAIIAASLYAGDMKRHKRRVLVPPETD
jgi:hypothetical protein